MCRRFLARLSRCCPRWGLLAVAAVLAGPVAAQPSREYDLKAVFLYNFASFVDWPREALPEAAQPFVIGVLGQDPFGRALEEVVAGEKAHGASLQVRRCQTVAEARECHILFIGASEAPRLAAILQELKGRPVLTVADMPRFLETGGIIAFSTDGRVQLHVNTATARLAGLTISSKLLRVAKVVDTAPPP
jgi:hypothetical protein